MTVNRQLANGHSKPPYYHQLVKGLPTHDCPIVSQGDLVNFSAIKKNFKSEYCCIKKKLYQHATSSQPKTPLNVGFT